MLLDISAMFLHDAFALRLFPISMQRDNTFRATYIYVYIRFKEIHINTHVLSRSIYTIGNTENNNWSPLNKLNPEQYRSSNNTNNTFGRELKTLALQIFAFVSLAVKLPSLYPSNDERAERVDSNLVLARVIFNSIFVCTL